MLVSHQPISSTSISSAVSPPHTVRFLFSASGYVRPDTSLLPYPIHDAAQVPNILPRASCVALPTPASSSMPATSVSRVLTQASCVPAQASHVPTEATYSSASAGPSSLHPAIAQTSVHRNRNCVGWWVVICGRTEREPHSKRQGEPITLLLRSANCYL